MSGQRRGAAAVEHVRAQVRNALDPNGGPPVQATYARTAAETLQDFRDVYAAGQVLVRGGIVRDTALENEDAVLDRMQLGELRDLADIAGLMPRPVVGDDAAGYGPAPLIREVAGPWTEVIGLGKRPVVPAFNTAGPFGAVDPTMPMSDDDGIPIADAGGAAGKHLAVATLNVSRLLLDSVGPRGNALLDQIVLDEVDARAEEFVAELLVAEAGGTRAAAGDVGAALDEAEAAASVRGGVGFVVVSPVDLPVVRRALPSTWADLPHPVMLVSGGQPAGTVTYAGAGSVVLLADDYEGMAAPLPKVLGKAVALGRYFYVTVRDPDTVQTVTGI